MLGDKVIGFLGAGSMTEAMVQGLLAAALVRPGQIWLTNRGNTQRLAELAERFRVQVTTDKSQVVRGADILVLGCKPKDVNGLLDEVGPLTRPGQVLLSVAAGISTETLADGVVPGVHVVRSMPNTSSVLRLSATAFCGGAGCSSEALALCRIVLGAIGIVEEVPEPLLDAVTGLSGSGPAYIYLLAEAMISAGESLGLEPGVTRALVRQTVLGAAHMLTDTMADPALLRQKVTSPGGTTQAAMELLTAAGFMPQLHKAIHRAAERSREMGAQWARRAASD